MVISKSVNLEHPLVNFNLPYDLIQLNYNKVYQKVKFIVTIKFAENILVQRFACLY